jgi:Ca-activated chloride channel family protein
MFSSAMCIVPKVSVNITLRNDLAETELMFHCVNSGNQAIQAPFAVPVPIGAMLSPNVNEKNELGGRFPSPANCTLHAVREASDPWQNLAKQQANPAAVEFCGLPLLKTNPIHIPAGESQPITLNYLYTCPSTGPRVDYLLPRSESVEYSVPWSMQVDIQSDQSIATVYSPSHKMTSKRLSATSFQVKVDDNEAAQPGRFWLSYLLDQGGLSATLYTQPDDATPEADGTFLFLAGVSANPEAGQGIPRELTLALDRSGSMQGQKIDQVREAATQVLDGLNENESFNIITYNDKVITFADKPVRKTADNFDAACKFIESVQPRGGTNLHGALLESVRQEPSPRTLPIVLFLTDGLPTVGETAEATIRDVIASKNPYHQRIFTVGVGVDVNTPLLEAIASETRAVPTFVLPAENIKTKISQVFQSLERPILADAGLEILGETGQTDAPRVSDVFPDPLPDLFQDDHLVVLGRYQGTDPLTFRVQGNYLGEEKTFEFTFPLKGQPAHPFVSRLWATQKIAALVQEIRKSGATADPYEILANPKQDARLKSLADDILKLTTRCGILTE